MSEKEQDGHKDTLHLSSKKEGGIEKSLETQEALNILRNRVDQKNQEKAEKSLLELAKLLEITKVSEESHKEQKNRTQDTPTHNDPLSLITLKTPINKEDIKQNMSISRAIPVGLQGAKQGTKESIISVGRSIKKLALDAIYLPYDIFQYFNK